MSIFALAALLAVEAARTPRPQGSDGASAPDGGQTRMVVNLVPLC